MEIYLIRHTTPNVAKGVCYGQANIDVTETFHQEASQIKPHLPLGIQQVHCSPLQRCRKLAEALFPQVAVQFHDGLKEMNFGDWELKKWDEIPNDETQLWMADFVNVCVPNGENYVQLYERSVQLFHQFIQPAPVAIVTHGGVIRSLLSYLSNTPLKDSFSAFSLPYGCVVKITKDNNQYTYKIFS
ncbi:alpha-ribazole phosphatase [Pinibacter aurantiacus]|uniref:Alpha-ribazole phosphatase n=1 Tax=Pinibacter aurantiacus TaxID=2851599 RepID=A0A9E2W381_9BACT|nr:alpha-ribazole phosphatase [Pinibacter aurantiacus]MBV4358230.1 alpha-ribazole phosphatase [Pinibacter aurantiacus]